MRIRPELFAWNNLSGPQWIQPELSREELGELSEGMVAFVGHDPAAPDRAVILGSGFIVGVADTLIVATASHIFTWWAEKLYPSAPHALKGVAGDRDDVKRRVQNVVQAQRIAASVNPMRGISGLMLPIVGLAINSNPRDLDIGFVQLALPPQADRNRFRTILIDADPFSFQGDTVFMAGFVGGGREWAQPFEAGIYQFELAVRAGRVAELAKEADGHRYAMYRVNIPSVPGMSGGPLMLLRPTDNGTLSIVTAVGVISSSRLGSPIVLNHCEEGETWVSPMLAGLGRRVIISGKPTAMSDAIHEGIIPSYGIHAGRFEFTRTESNGLAMTTARERDKRSDRRERRSRRRKG